MTKMVDFFWDISPTTIFVLLGLTSSLFLSARYLIAVRTQFKLVEKLRTSNENLPSDIESPFLTGKEWENSITRMVDYARDFNPDHVVGVHLGGRLLSSLLCERLQIEKSRCHYLETPRATGGLPKLYLAGNRGPEGRVLVVDDITRRGGTIASASKYFVNQAGERQLKIDELNFATLIQVVNGSKADHGYIAPDWTAYRSATETFQLPWTAVSSLIEAKYRSQKLEEDTKGPEIDFYKNLISDFEFALFVANLALNDIDEVKKMSALNGSYHAWKGQNAA